MIDRRHVVLGICIVAAIGTSPEDEPPPIYLFQGREDLQTAPFTLDAARPKRAWTITAQVVLPPEAEQVGFDSQIGARVWYVDGETEHDPITHRLDDCAEEVISGGEMEWPSYVGFNDAFVDCTPETACARTVCLEVEISNDEVPAEVNLTTSAWVDAWEVIDGEPIEVPIEIAIEEIEP